MFTHRLSDTAELRILQRRDAAKLFETVDRNRDYLARWLPWVIRTNAVLDSEAFIEEELLNFRPRI